MTGRSMFRFGRRIAVALAALSIILPIAAARADAFVYWTVFGSAGNGMVSRANTDGTSPNYTFLKGLFGAQAIAVDSTYLYWANGPEGIGRATLDGKTVESNFIVAAFTATALAVDSKNGFIYWTNARTGHDRPGAPQRRHRGDSTTPSSTRSAHRPGWPSTASTAICTGRSTPGRVRA